MVRQLIYCILFIMVVVACEEVYRPDLEDVDDFLVVEAILIANQSQNNIYLYKTLGFNEENQNYPSVSNALVFLVDANDNNYKVQCEEIGAGVYQLNFNLDVNGSYYLSIVYDGEEYQSGVQTVPEKPIMDSVYADFSTRVVTTGVSNSTDKIEKEKGIQVYANMNYKGGLNHYRFYARKIIQYIDHYDTAIGLSPEPEERPIFRWNSKYPTGIYNIAGPPAYSTNRNISRHALEFFESDFNKYIDDTMSFSGWIYLIYQYGINESTYNFYSDLNSQLDAEGKIFDPVYIQAEGNIACVSNPEKVVLGNFEISSFSESRFYLNYSKMRDTITAFRNIPYFYNIPEWGYIKDKQPAFWERNSRNYPNE